MKAVVALVVAAFFAYAGGCEPACKCNPIEETVYCTENFKGEMLMACANFRLEITPCSNPPPPLMPSSSQPEIRLPVERFVRKETFREVRITHVHQQSVLRTSTISVVTETASVYYSDNNVDYNDQPRPQQTKNSRELFVEHLMAQLDEYKVLFGVAVVALVMILLLLLICRHNMPGQLVIFLQMLARMLWLLLRGRIFRADRDAAVREILARTAEARRDLFDRESARNRRLEERLQSLDESTESTDQGGNNANPTQLNPQQQHNGRLPNANNPQDGAAVDQGQPLIDFGNPPDVRLAIPTAAEPENAADQPENTADQPEIAVDPPANTTHRPKGAAATKPPNVLPKTASTTFLGLKIVNPFRSRPLEPSFSQRRQSLNANSGYYSHDDYLNGITQFGRVTYEPQRYDAVTGGSRPPSGPQHRISASIH